MVATGWRQRFDEPISLPDGRKQITLRDAAPEIVADQFCRESMDEDPARVGPE
jgi:hypothetical protein